MANVETINTECTHYWILTPPSGELTSGTCKKCGTEKQFTGETSYKKQSLYRKPSLESGKK